MLSAKRTLHSRRQSLSARHSSLDLSDSSIPGYTANIYEKLQVPDILAAVGDPSRKGLI